LHDSINHILWSRGEMIIDVVSRFAPSPTGRLHLGHALSALQAYDFARGRGGRFLLRIEDIDPGRFRREFVDGIMEDMAWLGLTWDGDVLHQSRRLEAYDTALEHLKAMGLAYRCWCTRADLASAAEGQEGGTGRVYPGTCKGRTDPGDGRPFCWRLDSAKALTLSGPLSWSDSVAGEQAVDLTSHGDVVIMRKDAPASYHLAVTVDDAAQGVSDVVRGMDLFEETHVHRLLQALLDLPVPHYHHHRLIAGNDGARLAKSKGSPTLGSLRQSGVDPAELMAGMRAGRFPLGFALMGD
jgi:glutamyl-Q tRNA(Asp) synthetase